MPYSQDDHYIVNSILDDINLLAAIDMNAAVGAVLSKTFEQPVTVTRFGYRTIVGFNYDGLVTQGVLAIYKVPAGVWANRVLLGVMNLADGDLAADCPFCDLDNKPVAAVAPYTGLVPYGTCDLQASDQVVVYILTQAVGGGYLAGTFQPFFCYHPRAEEALNQPRMIDRTPAKTAVNSNIAAAEATENP